MDKGQEFCISQFIYWAIFYNRPQVCLSKMYNYLTIIPRRNTHFAWIRLDFVTFCFIKISDCVKFNLLRQVLKFHVNRNLNQSLQCWQKLNKNYHQIHSLFSIDIRCGLYAAQATNLHGNLAYHTDTYGSWLDAGYSIMSLVKLHFI